MWCLARLNRVGGLPGAGNFFEKSRTMDSGNVVESCPVQFTIEVMHKALIVYTHHDS